MSQSNDSNQKFMISHPAVRFEDAPIVTGRLADFNQIRPEVLKGTVARTEAAFSKSSLDLALGEALFQEKQRLKRQKRFRLSSISTYSRRKGDVKLWGEVKRGLLKNPTEADRNVLLNRVLSHYAEEIGGHFNPKVYEFATLIVPWVFNWLLNVASFKRVLPWGLSGSLKSQLRVLGEVPLLQKLSKKGTILLVPTHQSNIDSILIGYVIYLMSLPPFAYGAGLNLFMNPVLSFFMSSLGAYTVDRQKVSALYKTLLKNYSTQILTEGIHSIFFPGGGRSRNGSIESRLKLGLLGTGLEAQYENLKAGKEHPNVYVVPMVTSYDFVLEASSLIEDFLFQLGKHRYMLPSSDEPPQFIKSAKFFWKLFSTRSGVTVRIGRPMDVFGNMVDDEGVAIGPNGTSVDPAAWLSSCGKLSLDPQRDQEYTRQLGRKLVDRYYEENVVLPSHLVAFSFFLSLRKRYPDLDLYRFLRLSLAQRVVPRAEFLMEAQEIHKKVIQASESGELHVGPELQHSNTEQWVREGMQSLGIFHSSKVVFMRDGLVGTEDMNLLYYYRNRLSGYGISLLGEEGKVKRLRGEIDEQGFLA